MTTASETGVICRFCLFGQEDKHNPLLSPCKCRGSIEWVHRNCLQKWFAVSEGAQICQLCRSEFYIPQFMKLEIVPRPADDGAWYFLARPYLPIALVYCLHSHFMIIYPSLYQKIPHEYIFMCLQTLFTMFYVGFYFKYIAQLHNGRRYASYWLRTEVFSNDFVHNPLGLFLFAVFNYAAVPIVGIAPFGGLYMWSLSKFLPVHQAICMDMNQNPVTN